MRRVCAPPRTDPLTHQHDLDCDFACVLRKLSRDTQRSFSSLSFWHYFQVLVQNFLRLRRASDDLSLTARGPGSSPGRAESQLSQVSSGSFLIFSVLNGQRCSSCRAPQPQPQAQAQATQRESTAGAAGRRSEHQRSSVAATAAAAEDDAAAAVPPPPLWSVLLLSVGVSSVSGVHTASNVRTWRPGLAGLRPYFSAKNGK